MMKKFLIGLPLSVFAIHALADNPLYETGPAQDSSFVRFVNAADDKANITNGAAKLSLSNQGDGRVSKFFPVKAGAKLSASIQVGSAKTNVNVSAKAGEFLTIAIIPKNKEISTQVVSEGSSDFNAMRSSVALFNLNEQCASSGLYSNPKNQAIFEKVKPAAAERRLVNAVKLSAQVKCNDAMAGKALEFGQLEAGERYSVFVYKNKAGLQSFFVKDEN